MISTLIKNASANLLAGPIRLMLNLWLVSSLEPFDYGIMVIPMMVYSLSQLFVDMGFNSSLIQKAVKKRSHFSSVFFLNLFVAVSVGLIISIFAPYLARLYRIPEIEGGIYIISLSLIIRSASLTSEAILQIRQKFHQLVLIDLVCHTVAYSLAIYLGKKGYGYKSLLYFVSVVSILYTFSIMLYAKFIPRINEIIPKYWVIHWRFSKPLLLKSVLSNFSTKFDELLLANLVSVKNVGLYSKGKDLASYVGVFVSKIFSRPLFVILSKNSRRSVAISNINLMMINNLYFVLFFTYFLYKIFGQEVLIYILGEQWDGLNVLIPVFIFSIFVYIGSVFSSYVLLSMALTRELLIGEITHLVVKFLLVFFLLFLSVYDFGISELQLLRFFLMAQVIGYGVRMLVQCYYVCKKMLSGFTSNYVIPFLLAIAIWEIVNNSNFPVYLNILGLATSVLLLFMYNYLNRNKITLFVNQFKTN